MPVIAPMKAILLTLVLTGAMGCAASQAVAQDIGKKECMADAKRLCPAQVKALDRPGAERCLLSNIDQTTPTCHDTILMIAKQRAEKADPAAPKSAADSSSAGAPAAPRKSSGNPHSN